MLIGTSPSGNELGSTMLLTPAEPLANIRRIYGFAEGRVILHDRGYGFILLEDERGEPVRRVIPERGNRDRCSCAVTSKLFSVSCVYKAETIRVFDAPKSI